METIFQKKIYCEDISPNSSYFLAGDIGGTNSNFGIFSVKDEKPLLLFSLHVKSKTVTNYAELIKNVCEDVQKFHGITLTEACLGAAGIVSENRTYAKPTNLEVSLNTSEIEKASGLKTVILINDFEAVGLGIDYINPKDIITVYSGKTRPRAHKACIGAGTGLGKAALLWNSYFKKYLPFASEGGHADCAAQNLFEINLFEFIKKEKNHHCPISWEDILSGTGIQRIYRFLATQKAYPETAFSREIEEKSFDPDRISYYGKQNDERCQDTFKLYALFYARCAKNFVLDTLALNGMYIAGGIAAKNVSIFFESIFVNEFQRCGKYSELLKTVPLFIIADYNVSLYGAWAFMNLYKAHVL